MAYPLFNIYDADTSYPFIVYTAESRNFKFFSSVFELYLSIQLKFIFIPFETRLYIIFYIYGSIYQFLYHLRDVLTNTKVGMYNIAMIP